MARPQGGLGRGLEALIPASNQSTALANRPEDMSDGRMESRQVLRKLSDWVLTLKFR